MSQFPRQTAATLFKSENRSRMAGYARRYVPAAAIFALLFCLFYFNALGTVQPQWFEKFDHDSESVVLGRLAASRQEGILAHGGMLGHYSNTGQTILPETALQIQTYEGQARLAQWIPYTPQIGIQGIVFGLIDKLLPPREGNFGVFLGITVFFNAVVITLLAMWILAEIGTGALVAVALGLVFYSSWFTIYGRNLYWIFGSFFLPMLVTAWGYRRAERRSQFPGKAVLAALFAAFFFRFGCGYEYMTCVALSAGVPVVFYAVRDRWSLAHFGKATAAIGGVAFIAFLATFMVNLFMLAAQSGGTDIALRQILSHAEIRLGMPLLGKNFIDPSLLENTASLHAGLWMVLGIYLRGFIDGPGLAIREIGWPPTFGVAVLIALAGGLFATVRRHESRVPSPRLQKQFALAAATGAGFLASISWFAIARQHSFIHQHLNFVLWYVPFMFMLFALLGDMAAGFLMLEPKPVIAIPEEEEIPPSLPESLAEIVTPKTRARKKSAAKSTAKRRPRKPPAPKS